MNAEKILVVDDEEDILELVRFNLVREGFQVRCADAGEEALELLKTEPFGLVVLDLMLPGMDGFEVARRMRRMPACRSVPIVMLTAKTEESDVVSGLEMGAEDYVTKPFSPRILIARIRAVLRRTGGGEGDTKLVQLPDLVVNTSKHEVVVRGRPVELTYTEFEVLACLAHRPGWVFSRSQIVDAVRGENYSVTDRSVDVQIVGLRKKLGPCGNYIETVRGVGYRFRDLHAN